MFTIVSSRKHPSGDYRTLDARREGAFRGVTQWPSQVLAGTQGQDLRDILLTLPTHFLLCMTGVLGTVVRMMKYPISIILAIIACTYALAIMSDPVRFALAPMCSIPVVSLVCLAIAPAEPSRSSNPERSPLWANFQKLMKVESEALEFFIDETAELFALAFKIEEAGMEISDLVTRVRVSNMGRREALAESLSEFEKDAPTMGHGLTRFGYSVGSSIDQYVDLRSAWS